MLFTMQLVVGLAAGAAMLALSRRASRSVGSAWPWVALALGALATTAIAVPLSPFGQSGLPRWFPSIALPAAAFVFCVGRVLAGDKRWQSWTGLALASAPMLFWVVFVIGEVVGPAH